MAECIEREATIKRIEEVYCVGCNSYNGVRCRACGTGDAIDMIEDAPTVDAVIVTRCKDCKHKGWVQEPCHGKSVDYCKVWDCTLRNLESTFCSYGERKDGGAE
jgi:hypothetical protein